MAASAEAVSIAQPERLKGKWWFLPLGFGLTFLHHFWYGSPWTAWLALICYAPFLAFLYTDCRRPFLAGWLFGIWYSLLNMYWLGQFVGKWTNSGLVGAFVVLIVGAIWGLCYGAAAWLTVKLTKAPKVFAEIRPLSSLFHYGDSNLSKDPTTIKRSWLKSGLETLPFCFGMSGLLFILAEIIRQNLPELRFPFCQFGDQLVVYPWFSSSVHPLFYGVLINVGIAMLLVRSPNGNVFFASLFLIFYGVVQFGAEFFKHAPFSNIKPKTTDPVGVRIGLAQLGFDLAYADPQMAPFLIRDAGDRLLEKAKGQNLDLVIFPEAVAQFASEPSTPFRLIPDQKVLFGASRGTGPRYQSAFLWDGKGFSFTDKNNLVVFGEYVPFRNIIPYPSSFQLPSGDLKAGTERRPLRLRNGKTVGPMICFESLFSESATDFKRQNADFLAIMSLDDWYMGTSAIPRLEIAARWRAVETRKWVVRVGSLGKTMVINPKGEVVKELPIGSEELLVAEF